MYGAQVGALKPDRDSRCLPCHIWFLSSVGQSSPLITERSRVQIPKEPPYVVGSHQAIPYLIPMDTNLKGTITEVECQLYFLKKGYNVSIPLSPARYDFILDTGERFYTVQVKTSRPTESGFMFSTCSSHFVNGKVTHSSYEKDNIDFFCTCFNEEVYLIPVSECGKTEKNLRLIPTKNGQVKGISFAKDYIAEEVLKR